MSSSTLTISVEDVKGNDYSFSLNSDEFGCYFVEFEGSIKNALITNANATFKSAYSLEEVDTERTARIESVKVGDSVTLEMHEPQIRIVKNDDGDSYRNLVRSYVDVIASNGSVGILSSDVYDQLKHYTNNDAVEVKAVVCSVTPLSKRDKRSKRALISISIKILPKQGKQKYIFDKISGLIKYLKDSVYFNDGDMGYPVDGATEQMDEETKDFVKELESNVNSIDELAKITVETYYDYYEEEDYYEDDYSNTKQILDLKSGKYSEE